MKQSQPEESESGQQSPASQSRGRLVAAWFLKKKHLLYVLVSIYVAVAFSLSVLRFMEFYDRNWDFGIFQQALWSTTHGRIMWESGDYATFGVSSFFQIHPSFMMFPLAGLYALAPWPWTILLLQAMVTGLAALPLYYLAKKVTGSETKSLIAAGVFLAWAPVLSSNLYDFHLESFMPLELFTFFYLWISRRYLLGFTAAAVSCLTLEIAPVLIVFFLLFIYSDDVLILSRSVWSWLTGRTKQLLRVFLQQRSSRMNADRPEKSPDILWGAVMVIFVAVIYLILRLLQGPFLSLILGFQPAMSPAVDLSPGALNLSITYFPGGFFTKAGYWLLLYALLAFIPLKYPRTLIMVLPWLAWTFLTPYLNTVQLGYSYGYIAAVPMLIGFCYGLSKLDVSFEWVKEAPTSMTSGNPSSRRRRPSPLSIVILVILAANILISPVDPLVQTSEFTGAGMPGYWLSYDLEPGYSQVVSAAGLIEPSSSYVLASDDLFVLVANNANAYSTSTDSQSLGNTPFSSTNLPAYLFFSEKDSTHVPVFILNVLANTSDYGVRAVVETTPVGTVTLYQLGYTGMPTTYA
jgi:uncharacterized membrane protein